ncbi:hypothetical protein RhiJN_09320 [Ceratobasidium sp. AG-Ba]|nr:hypothetical protein RhiJN_09320 [Ceratobasidium sp. AG-Ba]
MIGANLRHSFLGIISRVFIAGAKVCLGVKGVILGDEHAQVPLERRWSGLVSSDDGPETLIERWPESRLRRYLELRNNHGFSAPSSKLVLLVRDALYTPIALSSYPPFIYCEDLTVDQLVYWATHFSAYRANPHGTNIFDASPTQAQSQAKREIAVELCKRAYDERIPKLDLREPGLSPGEEYERIAAHEGQKSIFFSELVLAETAPHVFEPDINYAVGRVAKHSIYDLRDLIDMFGGGWSEEDSHARLIELAKAHTALWIGQRP